MKLTLAQLRENRKKRIEQVKQSRQRSRDELLLIGNAKSEIWELPKDKTLRFDMRVLQFMATTDAQQLGYNKGDFGDFREYDTHSYIGPGYHSFVCPRVYNKSCPVCDKYWTYSKEERFSNNLAINNLKARRMVLFNALLQDTKKNWQVKIVRAGVFATRTQIQMAISNEAEMIRGTDSYTTEEKQQHIDALYGYADLEFGYPFTIDYRKAPAVDGGFAFEHFTKVDFSRYEDVLKRIQNDEEPDVVSQDTLDKITDLNLLLPAPIDADMIRQWMGEDVSEKTISPPTYQPATNEVPEAEEVDEEDWEEVEETKATVKEEVKEQVKKEKPKAKPKAKAENKAKTESTVETKEVKVDANKGDFDDDFDAFDNFS